MTRHHCTLQHTNMAGHIPLGPNVTLTASARTSTPLRMLARPSFENLMSLCAPLASVGCFALAAARRRAREEVEETRCIVVVVKRTKLLEWRDEEEWSTSPERWLRVGMTREVRSSRIFEVSRHPSHTRACDAVTVPEVSRSFDASRNLVAFSQARCSRVTAR